MLKDMESNSLYAEKRKFFLRFLKERNVYSRYVKYIHNEKYYNVYQTDNNNWSFDEAVKLHGMQNIISVLITWYETPEGFDYWNRLNNEFINSYLSKFKNG